MQSLWPTGLGTIAKAIERAHRIPDPVPEERSSECKFGYKHSVPDYRSTFRFGLEDLSNHIGICLDCFRSKQADAVSCQMTHKNQN